MFSVVLGASIAFAVTVALGSRFIAFLQTKKFGQFIREEGPQTHLIKSGTPTMGGVIFLVGVVAALVVVSRPNPATFTALILVAVAAGIGLYDDWQKITKRHNEGLSVRAKFLLLSLSVLVADVMALYFVGVTQNVVVPGLQSNLVLGSGVVSIVLFSILMLLVIVGTTNAVNLTDGLDGLAAGAGGIALLCYTAIAFLERQYDLAIICGAMVGGIIGFLWFNSHPAEVFMGDTGSLAIGGMLAAAAVLTKTEMLLPIIGGLFVLEALSVILQVASYKLTGKRLFKMAPIHHHFEFIGWQENKVVVRFWIIQSAFAAAGFMVYYLFLFNN
ncbi:mraY: phospho-N-acetylmuramoyl-pentapeptide-transferase [Rubrobacter radiotolerans]|uniref:Phospho-N-acetylmuramoyl-pentapeptide-transferase n=1 Tax=Rubrobacter radiotolerans TaxID=42256 RepID=A0A023X3L0_RUBRA|nr:phospho-N-acetylmuramoyl-pentapeptide-transferase [Rubrobacter radiotolerans]AHY46786.1 mraY: phospho-N-acetylmuramoyl-pentapeptide-transferase [Rubrobacter radiotolerans]MDX5894193.1 phospho-N-acetylmuramoyl-pentapeptide-transferase [Rubrobacter radiotolerans]SMC05447.1 Phospho-N-acetylmuramoyl-pentapeptide-transferase [Rubrobacter radiotolerans DSM 5868]